MPKTLKQRYESKLFFLFNRHLVAGKTWIDFREILAEKEKREKRKLSIKEKDELWKKWNKVQEGY